eukprot:g47190.t1
MSYGHGTGLLGNYPSSGSRGHLGSSISDYPESGSSQLGYGNFESYDDYSHSYRDYEQEREMERYSMSRDHGYGGMGGYGHDRSEVRFTKRKKGSRTSTHYYMILDLEGTELTEM